MMDLPSRRRVFVILFLAWVVVVPAIYYKRIWQIFYIGPLNWIRDNPSLADPARTLRFLLEGGLSAWELPDFTQALTRGLMAILSAGIILIAAQTLGGCICALMRCRFENRIEKIVFRAGIGFGVLAYLSLGMAGMGIYRPTFVRLLVWIAAGSGALLWLVRFLKQGDGKFSTETLGSVKRRITIWQAIVMLAILIALIGALAPEVEYDALWYHLWLPRLWLEHGAPVDIVTEYISLYPMTWELVYGAGLSMGGPITAKLLSFSCLLFCGLALYQTLHHFAPHASAWMVLAIWITTPTVLWEATTAYNDLALCFLTMLTIYAILRFTEAREIQWLVMAGLNAGFSLGIKHLALIILGLIAIGLVIKLWLATRQLNAAIVPAIALVVIALVIASPWYWRSWHASGNPVFPELYSVFGADPPQRWDALAEKGLGEFKDHFGSRRTFQALITLPWDMTIHAARYGGGLGPIFLIFVPGLLLFRHRGSWIPWLGWFVLLYIAVWASPLSSFQMRFLLPVVPLLAILAAEGAERLKYAAGDLPGNTGRRLLEAGIVLLCLLNLPPFLSLHEFDRVVWNGWLTHVIHTVPASVVLGKETETDYIISKVPSFDAWRYIDSHLAKDSRVLTFSGGDHFYSYSQRLWSNAVAARPAVWAPQRGEERQMLEALKSLGITHILIDKTKLGDLLGYNLAIVQPEVINTWYVKVYEDTTYILYRLLQQ